MSKIDINKAIVDPNGDGIATVLMNDLTTGSYQVSVEMGPSYSTKREEAREGIQTLMQALGPQSAPLLADLFVQGQDFPLADRIAKRMRLLLPPNVQKLEAAQSGEPPPPQPPPPPPPPEVLLKQAELQQAQQELQGKAEIEKMSLEVERIKMQTAMILAQTELQKAQLANQGIELGHAAKQRETETQHAAKMEQTTTQHAARMEQTETNAAAKMEQTELAHAAKMEQLRAKPAPGGEGG
jgi:hypothetical protein